MPPEALRSRAREVQRLVEQARAVVHAQFHGADRQPDSAGANQVGGVLDAIERLLPGIGILAVQWATRRDDPDERDGAQATSRTFAKETKRDRAEREALVRSLAEAVGSLLAEIERGRACVSKVPEAMESSRDLARRRH
jgi:hypothetical protein